ncbi:hypothetical protein PtB15_4B865 [Puccinia triticina]|nr:hypothetical protein PtB15_4B865 [Puccinia triticina]
MTTIDEGHFKEVEERRFDMEDEESDKQELASLLPSPVAHSEFLLAEEAGEPTSAVARGLWGFYSYSLAFEVFAIVGAGLFLPITLEQLARDNGYTLPNHQLACSGSIKSTPSAQAVASDLKGAACEVKLLGSWVNTASFPLYVSSIGVAIQTFVVASLSDAADDPIMRKLLLIFSTSIGSLAGMMFLFLDSSSSMWSLSALWAIVAGVGLGACGVCLNSFIPILAKTTPKVLEAKKELIHSRSSTSGEDEHYKTLISTATANISSNGVALGGTSGIIALCLALIYVISHGGNTDSLRGAIGFSGIWWALFGIPSVFLLPPRRSLSSVKIVNPFNPAKSFRGYLSMLREYKKLKNTIRFLMAWFLLSDAFSTLGSTAILFAKTNLGMSSSHVILLGLIVPTTGIGGALIAPRIQQKLKYCSGLNGSLNMFKILIASNCFVPVYVSISVVSGIPVLTTELEIFVLAGIYGFFHGAFSSYARSVYGELIPPGHEAKWFALFSITDKSSSFFGPLVVGVIADYTHEIRYGFLFILTVLLLSFPILNRIDVPSGKRKAEEFSRNAKG